ncbi:MAG: aspartate-semialdehyde dehydrogenase [Ruminococcaceae bacterium]|nr:aspartate-semialdehyde dehydrogenase [Oscillospiraceae bacterium]
MKKFNVGILGATGAVGREMMNILEERNFPVGELRLLASPRSVGKKITFKGEELTVQLADENAFEGLDIVLGAASNAVAKQLAPSIVKAGAVFVDNSSAFRMCDDVPLVIPEINAEDVKKNKGIISNPNCSTIITLVAVNAINKLSKIKGMVASTYQATSGAGAEGPIELRNQMNAIVNGGEITNNVFQYQIAENVIPHIGGFLDNGFTAEEMKMQNEGRKILHLPELKVTCTCVRVPVVRSHSISVTVLTEDNLTVEQVREAVANAAGCRLYDDGEKKEYPMPLVTSGQDIVYVGRIRKDLVFDNAITLWCCGDQVRKGAATNAIQIAEVVVNANTEA